jgi:AcrR family transcriptional regulator
LIISTARELAEDWDAVTTRRLAERIEHSQPVLYSHFAGKDAIVTVRGFAELATARASANTPERAVAGADTAFGADQHEQRLDLLIGQLVAPPGCGGG